MDRRGRLAQLLMPTLERRAAAPLSSARFWPSSPAPWRRTARRWFSTLIELKVPRGAGS